MLLYGNENEYEISKVESWDQETEKVECIG